MKIYKYTDQAGEHVITEEEILKCYYPWWKNKLESLGREHLISEENCIEDFITVHWATEEIL